MKNTKKIIIVTSVVLVLALVVGVILINPFKLKAKIVSAKQPVEITLPKADTSLKDFYNEKISSENIDEIIEEEEQKKEEEETGIEVH